MGGGASLPVRATRAAHNAYWGAAKLRNRGRHNTHEGRLQNYAIGKANVASALERSGLSRRARERNAAREEKALASRMLWEARRKAVAHRLAGAKRGVVNFFAGKVNRNELAPATNDEMNALIHANPNMNTGNASVVARKLAKLRASMGQTVKRKGGVAGFFGNVYRYGRNIVKHGRRQTNVERLESQRRRARAASRAAYAAIPLGATRNALEAGRRQLAAQKKELEEAARRAAAELKKGGKQLQQAAAAASADKPGKAKQLAAAGAQKVASAVRTMQPAANNSGGFFGRLGRLVGFTRKAKNAVQSPKGGELTPSKLTAAARSATAAGQQLALLPGASPGRQLALAGSAASSVAKSSAHAAAAAGKAAPKPSFLNKFFPSSANTRKKMGNQLRGKLVQTLAPALAQNPGARMGAMFQPNRYAGFGRNKGSTPASSAATVRSLSLSPRLLTGSNGSASTMRNGSVRTVRSASSRSRSGSARSGSAKSGLMLTN